MGPSAAWAGSTLRESHIPTAARARELTPSRPDSIPHLSQQASNSSDTPRGSVSSGPPALHPTHSQGQAGSPVKESSILHRGMSVDEQDGGEIAKELDKKASNGDQDPKGMPIRSS